MSYIDLKNPFPAIKENKKDIETLLEDSYKLQEKQNIYGVPSYSECKMSFGKYKDKVNKVIELNKDFNIIKLDYSLKRKIKIDGDSYKVPFYWGIKLPCQSTFIELRKYAQIISTKVPSPPEDVLNLIEKNKDKFDYCKVVWVPKQFSIKKEKRQSGDPIILGVIKFRKNKEVLFEIARWEEPEVEDVYWAHEAY